MKKSVLRRLEEALKAKPALTFLIIEGIYRRATKRYEIGHMSADVFLAYQELYDRASEAVDGL
jgi:hypothetical protein